MKSEYMEIVPQIKPVSEPDFAAFCTEVANAVGPSLRFESGQVRLHMSEEMLKLYNKYVKRETT